MILFLFKRTTLIAFHIILPFIAFCTNANYSKFDIFFRTIFIANYLLLRCNKRSLFLGDSLRRQNKGAHY